nr:hypothetical protein CFP56_58511 [Quercus suber]
MLGPVRNSDRPEATPPTPKPKDDLFLSSEHQSLAAGAAAHLVSGAGATALDLRCDSASSRDEVCGDANGGAPVLRGEEEVVFGFRRWS